MTDYPKAQTYRVFVRNWWRWEYQRAGFNTEHRARFKVPDPGARKTTLYRGLTEEGARQACADYAATHDPGPLSRKAEYEREDR